MNFVRHIAQDQRGSTAIEFAFVGPPFLLLLLAIFELGLTLTTQSVMDGAARDAARLIRTGQVQTQTSPISTFQNLLCAKMGAAAVGLELRQQDNLRSTGVREFRQRRLHPLRI